MSKSKNRLPYQPPPQGYLTIAGAAAMLKIDRRVVEDALHRGELASSTYLRPSICIALDDLAAWFKNPQPARGAASPGEVVGIFGHMLLERGPGKPAAKRAEPAADAERKQRTDVAADEAIADFINAQRADEGVR